MKKVTLPYSGIVYAIWIIFIFPKNIQSQEVSPSMSDKKLKVIELRNYLVSHGNRDRFIDTFAVYIEDSQNAKGAYIVGKFTIKNNEDHFFWIRGFESMETRKKSLEGFYNSTYWSRTKKVSAGVVVNFDNVHLLQPLNIADPVTTPAFPVSWFINDKKIMEVDFYIANGRRKEMIDLFRNKYDAILKASGNTCISYWISEDQPNNYPVLPMFQDQNLLVTLSMFENEEDFQNAAKKLQSITRPELNNEIMSIVTLHESLTLYRVRKHTFH